MTDRVDNAPSWYQNHWHTKSEILIILKEIQIEYETIAEILKKYVIVTKFIKKCRIYLQIPCYFKLRRGVSEKEFDNILLVYLSYSITCVICFQIYQDEFKTEWAVYCTCSAMKEQEKTENFLVLIICQKNRKHQDNKKFNAQMRWIMSLQLLNYSRLLLNLTYYFNFRLILFWKQEWKSLNFRKCRVTEILIFIFVSFCQ